MSDCPSKPCFHSLIRASPYNAVQLFRAEREVPTLVSIIDSHRLPSPQAKIDTGFREARIFVVSDDTALPRQVHGRRAGDGAPVLRAAVDAFIDGAPVAWEAAMVRGRTAGWRGCCLDVLDELQRAVVDVDEHLCAGGGVGQQR